MSNFDLTFCKVYIYAKEWPGINFGASHESCAHPIIEGGGTNTSWKSSNPETTRLMLTFLPLWKTSDQTNK